MTSSRPTSAPAQEEFETDIAEVEAVARSANSTIGRIVYWVGALISIGHIYVNMTMPISELWMSALHFAAFGFLSALIYPLLRVRSAKARKVVLAIDVLLAVGAVASGVYLVFREEALYAEGVNFNGWDWLFSIMALVLVTEFTRRSIGWSFPVLIALSLTYVTVWGSLIDGVMHFPGLSWEVLLYRNYFGGDGIFGQIAQISATYVFMFVLFAAFLMRSGAGEFIIQLAQCVAGRLVGGPGFVAVLGSALTGTVSGSAIANVMSTGVITIPLMKKAGFSPRFAAGVEAAASTGGQIMPPVMGTGAFIMATYTQIPYLTIAAVSFLPAVMYFISVGFWVRIESKRLGMTADPGNAPRARDVLASRGLPFLLPLVALVGTLMVGYTPTYAAGVGIAAVVAGSWLTKTPMGPRAIIDALALGARNSASTAVMLVSVGVIINVIGTTGIGETFSYMINDWGGGNLFVTMVLVALAALILGLGLPVTAAYIILATLTAPALFELIAKSTLVDAVAAGSVLTSAKAMIGLLVPDAMNALGASMPAGDAAALVDRIPQEQLRTVIQMAVDPALLVTALLSAHMIIFWLSQDSNVTPPVCLPAFAAAVIAGTGPMSTGMMAWKVAKGLYIVPFLFAYTPFLSGDTLMALRIFAVGTVGMYGIMGAVEGHLESPISWLTRIALAVAGVLLIWPHGVLVADLSAGAVVLGALAISIRADRQRMAGPRAVSLPT